MNKKRQYILDGSAFDPDVLHLDRWDKLTAIRLIANGLTSSRITEVVHRLSAQSIEKDINVGTEAVFAAQRGVLRLANNSIAAGNLSDPDTRANWLKWAISKGYGVDHLNPKNELTTNISSTLLKETKRPDDQLNFDELSDQQFIERKELAVWLKRSESSINRDIKDKPNFPQPISTGGRSVRFRVGDIRTYMKSL